MKKSYVLLAAICLIISILISIQSPINISHSFVLNGNALSEDVGFEQEVGADFEKNKDILENTGSNMETIASNELTKQTNKHGAGITLNIPSVELKTNAATNIGAEDEYKEPEVPKEETEQKVVEKKEPNKVQYKKLKDSNKIESFDTSASNVTYMGNFKLTAYCPCTKCCGKWGANRPVDENGYTIVGTASGARAYANHTIAVDPKVIPYGTKVIIERNGVFYEYVAEDCGGAIKNKRIDVYFDSHTTACEFGVRYGNVYIITE